MKRILVIFCLIFSIQFASATDNVNIISPGIKLGYVFGKHGGFTVGVEVSYVNWVKPFIGVGPTFNIDYFNKTLKFHLNAELVSFAGFSVGPSLILKDKNWHWGYNGSVFIGMNIYLFYNFTNIGKVKYEETGLLFKAPIFITGEVDIKNM